MLYTKEFEDVMRAFENYAKKAVRMGYQGLKREPRENWKQQWYYSDGLANEAFKAFLGGYSLGKAMHMQFLPGSKSNKQATDE